VAQNAARTSRHKWNRSIRLPVTTLDLLVAKYGKPSFVKIDVEGSEQEVLSGLEKAPKYLSLSLTPSLFPPPFHA
jgi:FkbM family methyltransferase